MTTTTDAGNGYTPAERARQAGYDDGYEDGREDGREVGAREAVQLALRFVAEVSAALESGDLRDLHPQHAEAWARARRATSLIGTG
jgi:flagellar biosynthesis/type III secretory pathway protein FliH